MDLQSFGVRAQPSKATFPATAGIQPPVALVDGESEAVRALAREEPEAVVELSVGAGVAEGRQGIGVRGQGHDRLGAAEHHHANHLRLAQF